MIPSTSSTSTLTSVPDPTPNRQRRKGPDMRKHSRDKWSKPKLHALLLSCLEVKTNLSARSSIGTGAIKSDIRTSQQRFFDRWLERHLAASPRLPPARC